MVQKAIKGSAIADHLAHHPLPKEDHVEIELPDEQLASMYEVSWTMHFDGALNSKGRGIGSVLVSPEGVSILQAACLAFPATNNKAEYEALISGLRHAHTLGVKRLRILGDSQLILRQVLGKYRTRDPKLKPYQDLVTLLARK